MRDWYADPSLHVLLLLLLLLCRYGWHAEPRRYDPTDPQVQRITGRRSLDAHMHVAAHGRGRGRQARHSLDTGVYHAYSVVADSPDPQPLPVGAPASKPIAIRGGSARAYSRSQSQGSAADTSGSVDPHHSPESSYGRSYGSSFGNKSGMHAKMHM
jgi:hypothetical protein